MRITEARNGGLGNLAPATLIEPAENAAACGGREPPRWAGGKSLTNGKGLETRRFAGTISFPLWPSCSATRIGVAERLRHIAQGVPLRGRDEPRASREANGMCLLLWGGGAPFGKAVANDVEHQRMQAKRRAKVEADARPLCGEVGLKTFQVFGDVRPCGEEVRKQEDSRGSALHAACRGLRNGWLGQFEIGDLDDGLTEALLQEIGELAEVVVGCRESAAMSNQQDGSA